MWLAHWRRLTFVLALNHLQTLDGRTVAVYVNTLNDPSFLGLHQPQHHGA